MRTPFGDADLAWRVLDQLPETGRQRLFEVGRIERFARGQQLQFADPAPEKVMFVRSGTVTISLGTSKGDHLLLRIARAGEPIDPAFAAADSRLRFSAVARSNVEVLSIAPRVVARLRREHPEIHAAVTGAAVRALEDVLTLLEEIALLPLHERLARRLIRFARSGGVSGAPARIDITQAELASAIAASRQATNRVLQSLVRSGLIELRTGHVIVKPAMLKLKT